MLVTASSRAKDREYTIFLQPHSSGLVLLDWVQGFVVKWCFVLYLKCLDIHQSRVGAGDQYESVARGENGGRYDEDGNLQCQFHP